MIGQRVEGGPGFPLAAVLWLITGAAFALPAAIFHNPHLAVFAALPTAIGLALLLVRERPFAAHLTDTGLDIEEPPLSLPYAAIEGARMEGKPGRARAPIQLVHADGVVSIPARLNVPSDELFAFLLGQLTPSGSRDLPASLVKYCAEQEGQFGPWRVFSYRARPHLGTRRRRGAIVVSLATAVAGLIWVTAGAFLAKQGEPWIAAGIMVTIFSGIFALAFRFEGSGPRIQNWRQSGLVISPVGLALIQGDMRGELRWDELRDIRYRSRPGFFEFQTSGTAHRGIHLVVAGATITVVDLYDRPLALIYERLRACWQGDADNA